MDRSLHPNLARVAAAYDEVLLEYQQGRITPHDARRRILALVARDDNGLEWSIDPETGQWRYKTHFGSHVLGDPPAYGVPGLTPHELGSGDGLASDRRVGFQDVDVEALKAAGSLAGSTLMTPGPARSTVSAGARVALVGFAVATGAAVLIWMAATLL